MQQYIGQKPGNTRRSGQRGEAVFQPEKKIRQQGGRIIGARYGNPENPEKEQQHNGKAGQPASKNTVQPSICFIAAFFRIENNPPA